MPRHDTPPPLTRSVVLRGLGLTLAVALSGVAAWLIVTGKTQKRLEIGVLAGLWAALLGAFAMFGSRRFSHPLEQPDDAAEHRSTELALRARSLELERAEEVAERRAYEARLEQMLRSEIEAAVARQVAVLRAEIATLRSELLEKVGGQLRLERIETTRVIGSDLEALQHEVRQLKQVAAPDPVDFGSRPRPGDTGTFRQVVEPARVRPVSRTTAEVEADVQPARVEPVVPAAAPEPAVPVTRPEPAPAETTGPIRADTADRTPRPTPGPGAHDELSSLPRLTPFTDFALDPVESTDDDRYTGRRRRSDDAAAPDGEGSGRHSRDSDESGRRHRRDGDGPDDDLLARLLAREGTRP